MHLVFYIYFLLFSLFKNIYKLFFIKGRAEHFGKAENSLVSFEGLNMHV